MELLTNSTSTGLWHRIIHEAEASCSIALHKELESYLVFLLDRYTGKPEILKQIIATSFLQAVNHQSPAQRHLLLQNIGDKCLLYTGLFPGIAKKRLVKLSYFISLGQSAYIGISEKNNDVYEKLAREFVSLMDVLQSIKEAPDLLPIEAFELWNETGSRRALAILQSYTNGTPVVFDLKDDNWK